jgi:hypothetical protein
MERYANLSGGSDVVLFEIGSDFIRSQFSDGAIYLYTNDSAGAQIIEQMKILARSGRSLGSFTTRVVRKKYARRER